MSKEYWQSKQDAEDREKVAACLLSLGLATGHGDTLDDLLSELKWQVEEIREQRDLLRKQLEDTTEAQNKIEDLTDRLNEGIKYVEKENRYVLVWTQRELDLAKIEANKIYNLFKDLKYDTTGELKDE